MLLVADNRCNLVIVASDNVINTEMSVMWVIHVQQVSSLLSVVLTTEENVYFFECDVLGLGDEEPDEEGQTYVTCHEEEE